MDDAGELDPVDEGASSPSWPLTIAIAAVIIVALVAGVFAIADGSSSAVAAGGTGGVPVEREPATTATPTTAASTTDAPTTTERTTTTAPPTTEAPTTVPPTTVPPTTAPPVTEPPPTVPPSTLPPLPAWVDVTSAEGAFAASFPSQPQVTSVPITYRGGTSVRTEYSVDVPTGGVLSVISLPTGLGGRTVPEMLLATADQVRRDLGGTLLLDDPRAVAGVTAQPFRVRISTGQVRAVALYAGGRLYTVSMYTPGRGDTTLVDGVFDRVLGSFRLV